MKSWSQNRFSRVINQDVIEDLPVMKKLFLGHQTDALLLFTNILSNCPLLYSFDERWLRLNQIERTWTRKRRTDSKKNVIEETCLKMLWQIVREYLKYPKWFEMMSELESLTVNNLYRCWQYHFVMIFNENWRIVY